MFDLGFETADADVHIIQVRYGATRFALRVGAIVGPCNIGCQPLPQIFSADAPFSGLTRRGDGSLMFQVDLGRLATRLQVQTEGKGRSGAKIRGGTQITSSDLRRLQQKIAYFNNYEPFCVPVHGIKQVVSVQKDAIHQVGERSFITLDGATVPLIWVEETLLGKPQLVREQYPILIYRIDDRLFGLPMDNFAGIIRMPTQYDNTLRSDAVTGTTVVEDKTCMVLDLFGLTARAFGAEIRAASKEVAKIKRLVLAEDDPFFREQLLSFLRARDLQCTAFPDGMALKEWLEKPENAAEVDAILSDIEMPRMDGLTLTRWVKGTEHTKHLPCLIITALTNKEVIRIAMSAGAIVGYVVTDLAFQPLMSRGIATKDVLDGLQFGGEVASVPGAPRVSLPLLLENTGGASAVKPLVIAVSVPLKDAFGSPCLLLWLLHDARSLYAEIFFPGRSGTTGEIYAFDREGRMLSDSRFQEHLHEIGLLEPGQQSSLRVHVRDPGVNLVEGGRTAVPPDRRPLTRAVASATSGETATDIDGFNDYRGVPVIGAWTWLDAYGLGVTHEIDVSEAYFNVRILLLVVFGLVALLLVATLLAGFFSARVAKAEARQRASQERLRQLNGEMAHVNRMATMGEMATGLAHELNQPLAAIANFARAALNELEGGNPSKERLRERFEQVERGALRSGEIIKRLRKFVAHREITAAPVDVAGLVQDPLKLLANELKGLNVTLAVEVPQGLTRVMGDEVQLQQVILNLIRNSLEAMRRLPGRTHRLGVSAQVAPDERGLIRLEVADTGPGIDAKVKERLFEQFNTGSASGMGLGLAISRTIIESHGGVIDVSRDSSEGTTFSIDLPVAEDQAGSVA